MTLQALPVHIVVIALLAVLALGMFAAAEKKGRSGLRWMLLFFGLWLGMLGLAAYGARWGFVRHYHTLPGFLIVYGPAVGGAFSAVLALRWLLSKKPALSEPKAAAPARTEPRPTPALLPTPIPQPAPALLPTPQQQPSPAHFPTPPPQPAPPPEPAVFKFACPHCGQRLAVTTAEVGTTANCPNCETPLEVPAPPDAAVGGG